MSQKKKNMRIGIIGYGVVGKACADGYRYLGHKVAVHDLKLDTKIEDLLLTDILFICVPSPSKEDFSCDISNVESCINELKEINYKGVICIKSTVEPGSTLKLSKKYNLDLCFVPEFLRERQALTDFIENHDLLAIGSTIKKQQDLIIKAHGHLPANIKLLNSTEAELLKYFSNSFNAMKVIFANNFYELSNLLGADYTKILDAYLERVLSTSDYLIANEKMRGYGGPCLPKDVRALIALTKKLKIPFDLFNAIDHDNQQIETTVFKGMREK